MLDLGSRTGENALLVAALGLPVLGGHGAERVLAIAREKARDQRFEVEFASADAFHLERLGRMLKTVLDCRLFHTFNSAPHLRARRAARIRGEPGVGDRARWNRLRVVLRRRRP